MARFMFGGTDDDRVEAVWAFGSRRIPTLASGVVITFYNAATDGARITDLSQDSAGALPIADVTSDADGYVPAFYGPDTVTTLWAQAGDSTRRFHMTPTDVGASATAARTAADEAAASAASVAPGVAGGVATLDAAAKLPETQVPDRLTDTNLSATYARKGEVLVKADGTGDYPTLQAAVAAVTSGTIRLDDGTHAVTGTARLNPAAGVRIVGNGYNSVVRLADGASATVFQISNPQVTLDSLRVDGNKAAQTATSSNAVQFNVGSDGGVVRNCWVHDAAGYGIVGWDNVARLTFEGNRSFNHEKEGIELHGATHSVIANNIVWGVGYSGIYLWNAGGDCGHCTVTGNVVYSCNGGIVVQNGAHDLTISGNVVYAMTAIGIDIGPGTGGVLPHSITVTGNVVRSCGGNGIATEGTARLVVTGNVVRDVTGTGISCTNSSGSTPNVGTVISGNNVIGSGLYGIWVKTLRKAVISANSVGESQREGIRLEGSDYNAITGNTVYNNSKAGAGSYDGIRLGGGGTTATYNTVTGNISRDDQAVPTQRIGINEDSATSGPNVVVGNVAKGSTSSQIVTRHASSVNANNLIV